MSLLLDTFKSGTFWTAIGSIATAIGVIWVIYKETRRKPDVDDRRPPGPQPPLGGGQGRRMTNREKIQSCLAKRPDGATLEQLATETGIPIGSLSSDLSGREAIGIEKEGYGSTAVYRMKPQGP